MTPAGLFYSAAELTNLGLAVLPRKVENIVRRADSEAWPFILTRAKLGGGTAGEIKRYTIPKYVQAAVALKRHREIQAEFAAQEQERDANALAALPTPYTPLAPRPPALSHHQRKVAEARAVILQYVLATAEQSGLRRGLNRAVHQVASAAAAHALPPSLAPLVSIANDRSGTSRTLTSATIYRWLSKYDPSQPRALDRLAPGNAGQAKRARWLRETTAPWADTALRLYQRPQKPTIRWVLEQLPKHLPEGINAPSYDSLRRFFASMGNVSLQAGRMGPRALKAIKPYVYRDKGDLWPGEVMMADGHQFDAEVAHPRHGKPFRPEITSVLCAGTRRLLGWSIDLAESGLAVLDALRVAVMNSCIGDIFYVDRGKGYCNAMISAPGAGLLSRLGMTLTHSLPYNSQARGAEERSHQMWVRAAKELPTYMGRDMDPEAKNKVYKLTRNDIKQFGQSRRLMPWQDFLQFIAEHAERYNNQPHRGLPKIADPETGKARHMTPNEAWHEGVREAEQKGRMMITLDPVDTDALFRPQRACRVVRGQVTLFGNTYFSPELTEHHGDGVNVGYDIHDPSQVWVHDADGVLICKAELDGNKLPMFPDSMRAEARSVVEQAAYARAKGREKRLQDKLDEVREELRGTPLVLENNPAPQVPLVIDAATEAVQAQIEAISATSKPAAPKRPFFMTPNARYEWLKTQGHDKWEESDCAFLCKYVQDEDGYALFAERYELLGMAWSNEDQQYAKRVTDAARQAA
ncbi:Mu transposase C-terminal domain-containing protein [Achromobacter xylosoxidans]